MVITTMNFVITTNWLKNKIVERKKRNNNDNK